jgi:hypothetical protein
LTDALLLDEMELQYNALSGSNGISVGRTGSQWVERDADDPLLERQDLKQLLVLRQSYGYRLWQSCKDNQPLVIQKLSVALCESKFVNVRKFSVVMVCLI